MTTCLMRKNSVLPPARLYASVPVELYTPRIEKIASMTIIAQIARSPLNSAYILVPSDTVLC